MKIAIKLLSDSDLSLFEGHVARAGRRAIGLDANVFAGRFYPGLGMMSEQVILPLVIVGPGGGGAHRLTREVRRARDSSGWELGSELIRDPLNKPGHYAALAVGDYGIFAFEGVGRPVIVNLVLVSARDDSSLHEAISVRCGFTTGNAAVVVSKILIGELRTATSEAYPGEHPLDVLGFRDTVEEVLFGDTASAPSLRRTSESAIPMPHAELRQQLLWAGEAVQWGEELFGMWLVATGHSEDEFEWVSQAHVRSEFDYVVRSVKWVDGAPDVFVIVKATRGAFERPVHLSVGELRFAARVENCRIARLYGVDGESAMIRILAGVNAVAARMLKSLEALPPGVGAESLRIEPAIFPVEWESVLT